MCISLCRSFPHVADDIRLQIRVGAAASCRCSGTGNGVTVVSGPCGSDIGQRRIACAVHNYLVGGSVIAPCCFCQVQIVTVGTASVCRKRSFIMGVTWHLRGGKRHGRCAARFLHRVEICIRRIETNRHTTASPGHPMSRQNIQTDWVGLTLM